MKIHTGFDQNSLDWLAARAGVLTASEFSQILTPQFKMREGEMPKTHLARKLAEKWLGPLPGFSTIDMDFGKILEEEAKPFYEVQFSEEIQSVAFITNDEGTVGCSPDGLIGDEGGIEIKCPEPTNHVKYLLGGKLPDDYTAQVHGSMFVTGRPWWKFMSYRRNLPPFVVTIFRDEEIQEKIAEAVAEFLANLDHQMGRMIEMNGGEPPKRPKIIRREPTEERFDVPTP